MPRRIATRDAVGLGLLVLAVVLLVVQLWLGFRGFDRFHRGFAGLLEVPGRALGWGSVALLAVVLPYLALDWLGSAARVRPIALLGALVLAIGVGALGGVLAERPAAGGGAVGGRLARLLEESLGSMLATTILAGIALPGALLALAPLWRRRRGDGTSPMAFAPKQSTEPTARAWYPERRVSDDGTEIPMAFDGSDVGQIRYREPEAPRAPTSDVPATEGVAGKPPRAKTIRGVRFADEEPNAQDSGDAFGSVRFRKDADAGSLAPGVRYADGAEPAEEEESPSEVGSDETEPEDSAGSGRGAGDEAASLAASAGADAPAPVEPPPSARVEAGGAAPLEEATREGPASKPSRRLPPKKAAKPSAPAAPPPLPPPPAVAAAAPPPPQIDEAASPPKERPKGRAEAPSKKATPPRPEPRQEPRPESKPEPRSMAKPEPARAKPAASSPKAPPAPPEEPPAAPARPPGKTEPVAKAPPAKAEPAAPARKGETSSKDRRERDGAPATAAKPAPATAPRAPAPPKGSKTAPEQRPAPPSRVSNAPEPVASATTASGVADPLYEAAVTAALDRGSTSLVHLKRALDVGYARASSLIEALVADGVLGEMTASGSRPTLVTAEQWARRSSGGKKGR